MRESDRVDHEAQVRPRKTLEARMIETDAKEAQNAVEETHVAHPLSDKAQSVIVESRVAKPLSVIFKTANALPVGAKARVLVGIVASNPHHYRHTLVLRTMNTNNPK
jgi:hypothetical protein